MKYTDCGSDKSGVINPSEGRESGIKGRFIFRFCDSSRQTEQPPEQKNSELTTTTTAEAAEH